MKNILSLYSIRKLPHKVLFVSVRVLFDPKIISFDALLRSYWRNIDPLDDKGQFCDKGESYRPVIFSKDDEQEKEGLLSKKFAADELGLPACPTPVPPR